MTGPIEILEPTEPERRALFTAPALPRAEATAWAAAEQAEAAAQARALGELTVRLLEAEAEARVWRQRCAVYEAHHDRLERAAADIRGRVEQFLVVLQAARPQGTERRAAHD